MLLSACREKNTLFRSLSSSRTGIDFVNRVTEDSLHNVLEYMNIYTGAGVAAGDVNNDGLIDLYFSANEGGGKLYINKGGLQFEDVTAKAGFVKDRWETGVAMVDINSDGWMDIYVNVSGSPRFGNTANLLYINNHDGTFSEQAEKYRIADKRQTMHSAFFDYDRDGDLDLFLITNPADEMLSGVNLITERKTHGESEGTDILYRNNGDGTFSDVSAAAGILIDGYSLGVAVSDVNLDGWPDVYVSNDFLTNDILYVNNHDGTFTDSISSFLKHTSFASMGNDVADFNNDGLPDIFVLDMLPEDNYRRKMIMPAASYDKFKMSLLKGYVPQYSRNTLQLNNGNGTFSDIAFLAGVSSTDWSWSSLWSDFDNDGDKDLMVTNGFYRDLGNLDYIHYQARLNNPMGRQDAKRAEKLKAILNLPEIPLQNYLFENNGDLTFTKRSEEWGFDERGFSNGACYADLDNDGDLELVINSFNDKAKVYENKSNELHPENFLNIKLKGSKSNIDGIGAKLFLYVGGNVQMQELNPYRGFESTMEFLLHFGLGASKNVDSLFVEWPEGRTQQIKNIAANKTLTVAWKDADSTTNHFLNNHQNVVEDVTAKLKIDYEHHENDFVDFKMQPLLPHMHSQNGPGIAVGDVNGDKLEDFYIGGASASEGCFYLQTPQGVFQRKPFAQHIQSEDMGVLLFDANGDDLNDLYVVSGGAENQQGTDAQQDRLYINDGKGGFTYAIDAIPDTKASGSCVVANDFDRDGDLDLFVGGRVTPGKYPMPCRSYLLQNDGKGRFTDVTQVVAPDLVNPGMVTSALWTDFDNDNMSDLVVAGEFMPLRFFRNVKGRLSEIKSGVENKSGWWNSIAAGDFDEDGDIDYVAGNLGLNSRFKASEKEPLCIYAKDFDKNGLLDPVMCYFVDNKNQIYPTRDEMIRQINPMRGRFKTYESFASVSFDESFTKDELKDAFVVKAECFESSYFENLGNRKFAIKPLPLVAQFAPVFGLLPGDFNNDGFTDVLVTGNSYATEASTGRYDGMKGMLLAGDGKGSFKEDKKYCSGFKADRDVKSLPEIFLKDGSDVVLVGNNDNKMEAYSFPDKASYVIVPHDDDAYAIIRKRSGKSYRHEFYFGNNYLSSSSRRLKVGRDVVSVTIYDNAGKKRNEALAN
jgi:enediyne biosynthesis protein E4